MNTSTLVCAVGNVIRHNQNTLKKGLLLPKYRQCCQAAASMKHSYLKTMNSAQEPVKTIKSKRKRICMQSNGGKVSLSIYGSGGYGAPRCIFLTSDNHNYVFNCGEGMQRLSQEHKMKLSRVRRAFITSSKWENIGGLIGLGLTFESLGTSPLHVHSPESLSTILKANEEFPKIAHVNMKFVVCNRYDAYRDVLMTVWHVPIKPNVVKNDIENIDDEDVQTATKTSGKRTLSKNYHKRKLLKTDCAETEVMLQEVVCYACRLHDRPGSLSLEKCVEYGVKPGPLLGKLKQGEDITLENGTVVRSTDVCTPKIRGPAFLVVDVPSKSYLESFLNEEKFKEYQNVENDECSVAYIFHFTPKEIVKDPRYVDWMIKFGPNTEHIVLDEDSYTISSAAIVKHQYMLNLIHPKVFPHLPNGEGENKEEDRKIDITDKEGNHLKAYVPNALDVFYLFPTLQRDSEQNIRLSPEEYVNECYNVDGFSEQLNDVQRNIEARTKSLSNANAEYPKVVMLGTGCSVPCKYRNTSGILLQTDESNCILMDCGEGILGQIQRRFNKSKYETILKEMKGIFISHLHADHHLGLFSIILKRAKLTKDPICIVAPDQYLSWMEAYHKKGEPILDSVKFYSSEYMHVDQRSIDFERKQSLYKYLNIRNICTTKVRHSGCAFGVTITLLTGEKITYSGDTMPSSNLISMGSDSDLLIHEATMDDTLTGLARKAQHTTTTEAIEVGRQMNAKFTLLTHFSQRYAKVPYITGGVNAPGMETVGIAYDFMDISISQVSLLPLFYPALLSLFADNVEEYEVRAARKLRRKNEEEELLADVSEL